MSKKRYAKNKARAAAKAFAKTGKRAIRSDVQGSYSGRCYAGQYDPPVQDADDL